MATHCHLQQADVPSKVGHEAFIMLKRRCKIDIIKLQIEMASNGTSTSSKAACKHTGTTTNKPTKDSHWAPYPRLCLQVVHGFFVLQKCEENGGGGLIKGGQKHHQSSTVLTSFRDFFLSHVLWRSGIGLYMVQNSSLNDLGRALSIEKSVRNKNSRLLAVYNSLFLK